MQEVLKPENLGSALRQVQANKGSPGIDGMTVDALPEFLRGHWPEIRQQLMNGTYRPRPVRRVEIPKPDGGTRKLGVPSALDRFMDALEEDEQVEEQRVRRATRQFGHGVLMARIASRAESRPAAHAQTRK